MRHLSFKMSTLITRKIWTSKMNSKNSIHISSCTFEFFFFQNISPYFFFTEDDKLNRRRKRNYELLDNSHHANKTSDLKESNTPTFTSRILPDESNPTCSLGEATKASPKKSQLAIHMENARKGLVGKFPESTCKKQSVKNVLSFSEKIPPKLLNGVHSNNKDRTNGNGEIPCCSEKLRPSMAQRENEHKININRLNSLTALTKETLVRVEKLTTNSPNTPKKFSETNPRRPKTSTSAKSSRDDRAGASSLRRMNFENLQSEASTHQHRNCSPVSILKRKTPVDDCKLETYTHTPPVTFSPSVKEPSTSNRKQGILKKRRSLDEAMVLRRRSCSPEVASKLDSKSILKTHRRSSLEELRRIHSPEAHLQSILKRKTSKNEEEHDQSFNSPQSILKRRSGASSAGSTANTTPHVSITTAVILAAASGAEMVLESYNSSVRPILKKKSFSDDQSLSDNSHSETPRPILKKKTSGEADDSDEKPRPILKLPRGSVERDSDKYFGQKDEETEVRPILKQSREDLSRSRLLFGENERNDSRERRLQRNARRSNTICADYTSAINNGVEDERSILKRQRPSSVFELNNASDQVSPLAFTGAIPKRGSMTRSSERLKQHQASLDDKTLRYG